MAQELPRYRFLLLGNNIIHDGVLPISTFFPGLPGLEMTFFGGVAYWGSAATHRVDLSFYTL